MKKTIIAAAATAVVHLSYVGTAVAQDDSLDFLLEDAIPAPSRQAPAEPAPAPAPPDEPVSAERSAQDEGAGADAPAEPAAEPALEESQAAESPEELDVIPLPREEPAPVAAAPRGRMVEEIIVTAQRREESAQDVPISITVFDGKQLGNANITNSADLALYTPSLSANTRFGADNATFSIRGFTQELRTTASVATYMAEVVAPRGQSSQTSGDGAGPGAMFDLANVQVLKGPQGTLFGRNTTGGAVLLVPNRPTEEFGGSLELSGGEWSTRRAQGIVNIPFSDSFRTRLAVDLNERDGHLNNITGIGTDAMGSVDYLSARFSTVWDISDSAENYTILSYIDSESTGYSSQLYGCNPNYLTGGFFLAFAGSLHVPACQDQLRRQAAAGQDGFYDVVSTIASPMTNIEEKRLINTLTWHLSDTVTLKNILAYAHLHTENGSDIFGTQFRYNTPLLRLPAVLQPVLDLLGLGGGGLPLDPNPNREFKTGVSVPNPNIPVTSQETYVAELQLQGESENGTFIWQGGLYFENSVPDGFSGNNSAGLLSCNMASLEGDPSGFDCYDPLGGVAGGVLVQEYKTEYLNQAVYAQGTWNISDQFSATLGLRYTWDESEGYGIKTAYRWLLAVPLGSTQEITTPRVKSDAPTGMIEFDYKPFDGMMAYAKYIRGYRQGNVILAADPGADTFEPEKVDTYEIGLKTLFGGPVPGQLNLAVFYNDFTDQQLQLGYISRNALQTTTIVNAGKSRIAGIEGDVLFSLSDNLTLALAFSLLETELLEQADQTERVRAAGGALAGFSVTPIADVGDELPYAPDQTYIASLNWQLPVSANLGEMNLGVTYSAIGEQRSAATSSGPYGMLDAFQTLNVNFGWGGIFGSSFDLVVFGTNVLDEEYVTYTSGTYNLLGYESRMLGTPRMVGARLKYRFGGDGL